MLLDVAAGVDWSAICAIMMCVQQVCSRPLYMHVLCRVMDVDIAQRSWGHPRDACQYSNSLTSMYKPL